MTGLTRRVSWVRRLSCRCGASAEMAYRYGMHRYSQYRYSWIQEWLALACEPLTAWQPIKGRELYHGEDAQLAAAQAGNQRRGDRERLGLRSQYQLRSPRPMGYNAGAFTAS